MGKDKCSAASSGVKPRPRDFRSAGAAVARSVAAIPKPTKVALVLKETGGTDSFVVSKQLRGGDRVLSGSVNRFAGLSGLGDVSDHANVPTAANAANA